MKKSILLIILFASIVSSINAQNLKTLDDKYGFREYKFETNISQFENLKLVEEKAGFKVYTKTDEKLKIGNFDLENIAYFFYKNQFANVMIKTKGYINSQGVLRALEELYGKGRQSNEYIERYAWLGNLVMMIYDENSITNDATILIQCKKLEEQREKDEKDASRKAIDDL